MAERQTTGRFGEAWRAFLRAVAGDAGRPDRPHPAPVFGPNDPEHGHTFHLEVRVRGAYTVAGRPPARDRVHDSTRWDEPVRLAVRASNLPDALELAARAPLTAWYRDHDDNDKET